MIKPHIIIDYDSTLANSQKAICEAYNEIYPLSVPADWHRVKRWDMSDQCPKLYEDGLTVMSLFAAPIFFRKVEYFEGAKETMDMWNKQGYEITICTAGCAKNLSQKILVLDNDFPYANLVPISIKGANGVGKSIVNMSGAIFIDDHIENLESSNAEYKILYKDENINPNVDWATISDKNEDIIEVVNWQELAMIVFIITHKLSSQLNNSI